MLIIFFAFLLFLMALILYSEKKYGEMLFCITTIANGFFGFEKLLGILGDAPSLRLSDIALLLIVVIWIQSFIKEKNKFFLLRNDSIGRIILYIFSYLTLVFIGTILLKQEVFRYSITVYKVFLGLPFYFVLKKISIRDFEKFIELMLYGSIIQGMFYYLQFIGLDGILSGYGSEGNNVVGGQIRLANYPSYGKFFALYYIFKENVSPVKKWFLVIFFIMMPIMGLMRGSVINIGIACLTFFILKRRRNSIIYLLLGLLFYEGIVSAVFEKRSSDAGISSVEELNIFLSDPLHAHEKYINDARGGTFLFRMGMLSERIEFMKENPQYLPFGVGCVNEYEKNNIYTMVLGTKSILPDGTVRESSLSSADNTWVGVLMRYGIVGVILLLMYYYKIITLTVNKISKSNNIIFLVYACYAIPSFLITFDSNNFDRITGILSLCCTSAYITIYLKHYYYAKISS